MGWAKAPDFCPDSMVTERIEDKKSSLEVEDTVEDGKLFRKRASDRINIRCQSGSVVSEPPQLIAYPAAIISSEV